MKIDIEDNYGLFYLNYNITDLNKDEDDVIQRQLKQYYEFNIYRNDNILTDGACGNNTGCNGGNGVCK